MTFGAVWRRGARAVMRNKESSLYGLIMNAPSYALDPNYVNGKYGRL